MLSKEEIEKAKERLVNLGKSIQTNCKEKSNMATSIETLLQYIEQLEQENNKQNKIIDEIIKVIIDKDICNYFIKDSCKHYSGENGKLCDECLKQCFEKKVG